MKQPPMRFWLTFLLSIVPTGVFASQITITSGAGYRQLVIDIAANCQKEDDLTINASYGNFGQMLAHIKMTGMIQAVISDQSFFSDNHVQASRYYPIGYGTLVLAWRKGLLLKSSQDLKRQDIKRIAIPNLKKALYGKAGKQYLQSSHLFSTIKPKLYVVATVPQVTSYLVTGEVDAGFTNLTDIQRVKNDIGGYLIIRHGYHPIKIVTGILKGHDTSDAITRYQQCITSKTVKEIAKRHGL
ncbi:MAG: hypothetical protein CENE_01859 [Candidatus Celerinatantimonas neptuna]|nr:MAG: hypothetical protein CENE_01859 [Candidatus Celerinatantimonas neptuna]